MSGSSTPLSFTSTLLSSPSPVLDLSAQEKGQRAPSVPASTLIEYISSRRKVSSTVFVYDLAEQVGFGTYSKSWSQSTVDVARVIDVQTRDGAGLGLVGRLAQGTSKDTGTGTTLTAYTTPSGLASMAQSLTYLPAATENARVVIQVPAVTPVGETLALSPSLASLGPALSILDDKFAVVLSATPQESVDLAALAYQVTDKHVIHLFDHYSATREVGSIGNPPSPKQGQETATLEAAIQDSAYNFFDYAGDENADTVVVLLNGPLAVAARAAATGVRGLGVISVRVLRPWSESALREVVPAGVKRVHVLDDVLTHSTQGSLFVDVFTSLVDPSKPSPSVHAHRIVPARTQEFISHPKTFAHFLTGFAPRAGSLSFETSNTKKVLFFSTPGTALAGLPQVTQDTFRLNSGISAHLLTEHDVFSRPSGVSVSRLVLSPKQDEEERLPLPIALPVTPGSEGVADLTAVLDSALLKSHSLLEHAKPGSPILVVSSWSPDEFAANLPIQALELIRKRSLHLCAIDAHSLADVVGAEGNEHGAVQAVIVHLAFLRLYLAEAATEDLVFAVARTAFGVNIGGIDLLKLNARAWAGLAEVDVADDAEDLVDAKPTVLKHFEFNAIALQTQDGETVVNGARLASWRDAAKHLLFPSAFSPSTAAISSFEQNPALHPEIADRTFLVTCTVNRRLTPAEYDRNVFHLEFDTAGTGLTYDIGEALGVHGWNDAQEVRDFCAWYGVDPGRLITVPVPGQEGALHTRTVFQALQQQVDLFGRPGKSFYSELAPYATGKVENHALLFIGSPEGVATFKKMAETETVSFAEVLRRFPTARPGIEVLCELIGDIKPRHYSIASSQAVVGDRVDLLVVSVDWVTPSGSPRYGQCTRYLAGLKVGQKVTVSIKASVMKLPPDHRQPLILAGLGTGAAPFRAFLQHRAWLAAQNVEVGPIYYYFGSRRQSEEYLYGEEIEAYIADGTIAKAGLAFSRDGPRKVYIQHKMGEDAEVLAALLQERRACFYMCGPTWPVSDIYEALVGAMETYRGYDRAGAAAYLEELKEEERYVLEVY